MRYRLAIGAAVAALLIGPVGAFAQIPGMGAVPGMGSLTGGFSKDSLLAQAKEMVSDLTSMKSSGKLAPEQTKQVDTLLPKATSLTSELEKPQVEAAKLPQLASDVKRSADSRSGPSSPHEVKSIASPPGDGACGVRRRARALRRAVDRASLGDAGEVGWLQGVGLVAPRLDRAWGRGRGP